MNKKKRLKDKLSANEKIRSRIHERTVSLRFRGKILKSWEFSDLRFPYTMLTLQTSFKTTFARGDSFAEVTVNSNEENSYDFCPYYVQDFGLCKKKSSRYVCMYSTVYVCTVYAGIHYGRNMYCWLLQPIHYSSKRIPFKDVFKDIPYYLQKRIYMITCPSGK